MANSKFAKQLKIWLKLPFHVIVQMIIKKPYSSLCINKAHRKYRVMKGAKHLYTTTGLNFRFIL